MKRLWKWFLWAFVIYVVGRTAVHRYLLMQCKECSLPHHFIGWRPE